MSKNGILVELKGIAYDMVDNNGNFRTVPIGTIGTRRLSNDRIRLLQYIISLVKDTDIVTQETKLYVFNRYISIKDVNIEINRVLEPTGKQYSYNTTASKIAYDRDKLQKLLGTDILADIAFRSENEDKIKIHTKNVINAHIKYGKHIKKDLRDGLALEINKNYLCTELDEDKFDQFLSDISPYLKSHMEKIAEEIDKDSVGYFNYLLYSPMLSDVDKQRLEKLKQRLDPSYIEAELIDIE